MVRYRAVITYDGTSLNGFQKQPNGHTVREEVERTLQKMANGKEIMAFGPGKTDIGIHAIGQVIHSGYSEERPLERIRFMLDTQSSEDTAVRRVGIVSEGLHARCLVEEKTRQSQVDIRKSCSPFRCYYASYFPYPLDSEEIQWALPDLLGVHDFTSFYALGSPMEDRVYTIYEAKMKANEIEDELLFTFRGNGFLYKMIRILVGMLLKIDNGRLPEGNIPDTIAKKGRNTTGPTAHPEGLYLHEVKYE